MHQSVVRAVLYAVMELTGTMEPDDVLAHLMMNVPNWYGDMNQREMAKEFSDYLAARLAEFRPEEAASARVLRDLIRNQRIGKRAGRSGSRQDFWLVSLGRTKTLGEFRYQ